MSRCYPFPPPGFVPNRVRDESLIEPIKKGTKEEEEVKRGKKDRKQHNKDKKRKDRDSEDVRSRKQQQHRRHHHKRQRKDEITANASKKVGDDELECLEKSCLTMEHENQSSSENENEGPYRIQSQPFDGRHNNDSETSVHDKGQDSPEVVMTNKKQRLSTELGDKKATKRQFSMQLRKEKRATSHQESIGSSKLCRKCPPSTAMRFSKLIENWAPDRFDETKRADSEDQELWLLMKVGAKRHRQVSVQTSSKGSSSMVWPTAQFLPEAELHALPFTVPF